MRLASWFQKRRLSRARGAEQSDGAGRLDEPGQAFEALARLRADRHDRHAGGDPLSFAGAFVHRVADVALREHDHRSRAALPDEQHVALETSHVEVTIETADDEGIVDIGRNDLLLGALACALA